MRIKLTRTSLYCGILAIIAMTFLVQDQISLGEFMMILIGLLIYLSVAEEKK